jgi:hypothetical protein
MALNYQFITGDRGKSPIQDLRFREALHSPPVRFDHHWRFEVQGFNQGGKILRAGGPGYVYFSEVHCVFSAVAIFDVNDTAPEWLTSFYSILSSSAQPIHIPNRIVKKPACFARHSVKFYPCGLFRFPTHQRYAGVTISTLGVVTAPRGGAASPRRRSAAMRSTTENEWAITHYSDLVAGFLSKPSTS